MAAEQIARLACAVAIVAARVSTDGKHDEDAAAARRKLASLDAWVAAGRPERTP